MVVVGRWRLDAALYSWDPSQQIQGLKCPSQPNPNKNNIETCSVKLPTIGFPLFAQEAPLVKMIAPAECNSMETLMRPAAAQQACHVPGLLDI